MHGSYYKTSYSLSLASSNLNLLGIYWMVFSLLFGEIHAFCSLLWHSIITLQEKFSQWCGGVWI